MLLHLNSGTLIFSNWATTATTTRIQLAIKGSFAEIRFPDGTIFDYA